MRPASLVSVVAFLTMIWLPASFAASSTSALYLQNPDGGAIRGLIIGIDAYEHVRPLKGSVADARDIEKTLRTMGIGDVTTLLDSQANRSNVLRRVNELVERTRANDLIILSIAGHGA